MEVWKDIPGYEGLYQASTDGMIRTLEGKTTIRKDGSVRHWKGRVMRGRGTQDVGFRVSLWKDGNNTEFLVHRLVARTFIGDPPSEDYTVNHIDGNRFNNKIENLEWMTRAENIKYGFRVGQYESVMSPVTITDVKGDFIYFRSQAECSRYLGRKKTYANDHIIKGNSKLASINGEKYWILFA